jgi:hypothetical protein
MSRWEEWITLAVLIGFVIYEAVGGYTGSQTHALVLR